MNKIRNAPKFNEDVKINLEDRGYKVYEEKKDIYERYNSKPDFVTMKDKTALIIETKSEKEAQDNSCLSYRDPDTYDKDNQSKTWRKYCRDLVHSEVAIWMVHINLQALCYPMLFDKSDTKENYHWHMNDYEVNEALKKCTRIPALAFPESYKKHVQEALRLMVIEINEGAFMKLGKGQLLLKFDSGQEMIEPTSNVESSES